jgi:phenylalanyl-tRNA synthetase alpha chain
MFSKLSDLSKEAQDKMNSVTSLAELLNFEVNFLGKKSILSEISRDLKNLPAGEKKEIGMNVGELRKKLSDFINSKKEVFEKQELEKQLENEWLDVTKEISRKNGSIHPISIIQKKVESVFSSMGFEIADGPEIETEWNNFDALNIPEHHPARDMQDTFWISRENPDSHKNFVLRTQTSDVQIRKMLANGAPVRLIAPGRVFRNEDIDASHGNVFYQVEGLLVDKGISLSHLKGTIETMLSKIFAKKVKVRLRPGFFTFVSPGFEVDFSCTICEGKGCKTCKNTGWVEFMGAGMVHPNVLKNCNVNPKEYSGFAFGFGLTRLAMMKFGIDDIRHLSSQKIDFLSQF